MLSVGPFNFTQHGGATLFPFLTEAGNSLEVGRLRPRGIRTTRRGRPGSRDRIFSPAPGRRAVEPTLRPRSRVQPAQRPDAPNGDGNLLRHARHDTPV